MRTLSRERAAFGIAASALSVAFVACVLPDYEKADGAAGSAGSAGSGGSAGAGGSAGTGGSAGSAGSAGSGGGASCGDQFSADTPTSCADGPQVYCGPERSDDCCTTTCVPGGSFSRSYAPASTSFLDPQYTAVVSPVYIDRSERAPLSAIPSGRDGAVIQPTRAGRRRPRSVPGLGPVVAPAGASVGLRRAAHQQRVLYLPPELVGRRRPASELRELVSSPRLLHMGWRPPAH